jgi:hypothetical protein
VAVRLWIEVEADGDAGVVRRLVEAACDGLMVALVDDELVVDPAISVSELGESQEWIAPLSSGA